MARWLVTQGDRQFAAQDLNELRDLARNGTLGPADMVQPPGASDWLYASELPELQGLLQNSSGNDDDDFDMPKRGMPKGIIAVVLLGMVAAAGYGMYHFAMGIKDANLDIMGEDGMALSEMLVTGDPAVMRSAPEDGAGQVGQANKDTRVQLVAKRGPWYQIKSDTGAEGWVAVDSVIPAYFFADAETRESYDPIYNPDRYVFVKNASWMQLPDQRRDNITIFQFLLQNKSKFDMDNVVLLATIKDKNDNVLEKKEIAIEGKIPSFDGAMVGTLGPDPKDRDSDGEYRLMTDYAFKQLLEHDEELQLRWSDGIEVQLETEGFIEANIDLLQVRAVPKKID